MATVVLASPDSWIAQIAGAIAGAGVPVVVVSLDPRVTDDATHELQYRAALACVRGPVIMGGFSLGGRIAARRSSQLAARQELLGLLCFGYPFHAAKLPSARHGLDALSRVRVPTRIMQGTRDPHGNQAEVRGYALPESVELVWLRDANHRFAPRERSGLCHDAHIQAAAAAAISFIRERQFVA